MVAAMGKVSLKNNPYAAIGDGGLRRGNLLWGIVGRLGSWLGLDGEVGRNVHSVNSGGLRSMAMANGMVHSSNSKAALASHVKAHNSIRFLMGVGTTMRSGHVFSRVCG